MSYIWAALIRYCYYSLFILLLLFLVMFAFLLLKVYYSKSKLCYLSRFILLFSWWHCRWEHGRLHAWLSTCHLHDACRVCCARSFMDFSRCVKNVELRRSRQGVTKGVIKSTKQLLRQTSRHVSFVDKLFCKYAPQSRARHAPRFDWVSRVSSSFFNSNPKCYDD